jgi:hypothetical protein
VHNESFGFLLLSFYFVVVSSNGTFVNGTKLGKGNRSLIRDGDEISLVVPSAALAAKKPQTADSMHLPPLVHKYQHYTAPCYVQIQTQCLYVIFFPLLAFVSYLFKDLAKAPQKLSVLFFNNELCDRVSFTVIFFFACRELMLCTIFERSWERKYKTL